MNTGTSFAVQLKPVGSACNIRCTYCYVEPFRPDKTKVMSLGVLERVIRSCVTTSATPTFSWHGGEPMLAGLPFFEKAWGFMQKWANGKPVRNVVQTNAMLVTPQFAQFFQKNGFGLSVSLDGPSQVHGASRVRTGKRDPAKDNTFNGVMRGINNLRDVGISPAVICTVGRNTLPYARDVFRFLVGEGFKEIKYSPVFDSVDDAFSLSADEWYSYLREVFEEWFALQDTSIHVRELDEVIAWMVNDPISCCSSNKSCVNWVSVDPEGNLYPCEYLRADMPYGNIMSMELPEILNAPGYHRFASEVSHVNSECAKCQYFSVCGNGCPATRIAGGQIASHGVYVYCRQRQQLHATIRDAFDGVLENR